MRVKQISAQDDYNVRSRRFALQVPRCVMKRVILALYLMVSCACVIPTNPVSARKDEELATRVQQLENRVKQLEKLVKLMRAQVKELRRTTVEKKLAGNWAVPDGTRKVEGICTDLKLNGDGTGKAVLNRPDGHWNNLTYDLVGKELQLTEERGNSSYSLAVRLHSVNDSELVLEYIIGETTQEVRYTRE
jgi:outer membrane murein-binding lipoprotein Lpp